MPHLTDAELDELANVAVASGLDTMRQALFPNPEMRAVRAAIVDMPTSASQLRVDLEELNNNPRTPSGIVPLERWLSYAGKLLQNAEQKAVVEAALDKVISSADGAPPVSIDAITDEIKEEIVHEDDLVPCSFLSTGASAGTGVVHIRVLPFKDGEPLLTSGAHRPHMGTAWLMTPTHVITNHHVVNARSRQGSSTPDAAQPDLSLQGSNAVVEWDYLDEQVPGIRQNCAALVAWDKELDYALLTLDEPSDRPPLPISANAAAFKVDSLDDRCAVNIIQHPGGDPKQVGLRNNLVLKTTDREVHYFTDTRRGSSGSPVLDDAWQVVALHKSARRVSDVKYQGRSSAFVNVGTRISAILEHIAAQFPNVNLFPGG